MLSPGKENYRYGVIGFDSKFRVEPNKKVIVRHKLCFNFIPSEFWTPPTPNFLLHSITYNNHIRPCINLVAELIPCGSVVVIVAENYGHVPCRFICCIMGYIEN